MSRETFAIFVEELRPFLPPGASPNRKSLSVEERLLMFLFFASGDIPEKHAAFTYEMAPSTVDKNVRFVVEAMYASFVDKFIRLPSRDEAKREYRLFRNKSPFPCKVFCAVDGSQIRVKMLDYFHLHTCFSYASFLPFWISGLLASSGIHFLPFILSLLIKVSSYFNFVFLLVSCFQAVFFPLPLFSAVQC